MFFSSKPSAPDPSPAAAATSNMDSESVKNAVIKQVMLESQTSNARTLIEKINEHCFEKCVPKPGSSMSSGEETCMSQCMEKYMAAWNQVNAAYVNRIREQEHHQ